MLKIDLNELSYEPKEYPFEGAVLLIRPYPESKSRQTFSPAGLVQEGQDRFEIFNYCLVGWKGVAGADGKELDCTEEIKRKVFDFNMAGIPGFVLLRSRVFEVEKERQEKNS